MTKKILLVLLALVMVFALASCKNDEPDPGEEPVVGGYTDVEDGTLTDELLGIFNAALEGYDGVKLEPVKLLQTQVVAGTNYKFLANETVVVPGATPKEVVVTIYKDLQGNTTITEVTDYEGEA